MKMTSKILIAGAFLALATTGAMAQTTQPDPGHPRVNEVDQRLQNQQNRINAGTANDTMTQAQAAKDEARDAKVSSELSADEAKNNGHITKAEQAKMNRQLNRDSTKIHNQKKAGTAPAAQ